MLLSRFVVGTLLGGMLAVSAGLVAGQDFPTKAIRISTVPAGGGTDVTSRLLAGGISGPLGVPVIVENRPTNIAILTVKQAPPDGYTVLVVGSSFWIQGLMQLKPEWDPENDFSPITLAIDQANVMAIHPSLPVKSVKELIALAKAKPGELLYSQGTPGGNSHLAGELFNSMGHVKITGVPYRASSGGLIALLSGEIQVGFENLPSTSMYTKSGKLRLLAVAARKRSALAPDTPTVEESGLPGYYLGSHHGVWAPAKTPPAIVRRLNQEMVRYIKSPEAKPKFLEYQAEPNGNSPEETATYIRNDIVRLSKVIKDAGIKPY